MPAKPMLTTENHSFWTGGQQGELRITFCHDCDHAIHPPQITCPACHGRNVAARAVAGTGVIYSFTFNHQPWTPDMKVPFGLAVVDVDGAAGVRVTGPVRTDHPDAIAIGQPVTVDFEALDEDIYLPVWKLVSETKA